MSNGASSDELVRLTGVYVGRILEGEPMLDLNQGAAGEML
jgi:hypothetical protein